MSAGDAEALASFFAQDSSETCGSGSAQSTAVSAPRTDEHGLHFFRGMGPKGPVRQLLLTTTPRQHGAKRRGARCVRALRSWVPEPGRGCAALRLDSNWDTTLVIL
eukprot:7381856-Prymnesium_polylepis.1